MKKKLAAVFFLISLTALRADWIYQQYEGDKWVSFSHQPAATTQQLKLAQVALEGVSGVQKVYIKGDSVFIVKDPKLPWGQIWPTIAETIFKVRPAPAGDSKDESKGSKDDSTEKSKSGEESGL